MNKKHKLLFSVIVILVLIIVSIILIKNSFIKINFCDDRIPPTTYNITINTFTKKMSVIEKESCSAVNCKGTTYNNSIVLTKEEYTLIKKIIKKYGNQKYEYLCSALSSISKHKEVMSTNGTSYYEEEYDINKDGTVTSREFGLIFLNYIYDEN